MKYTRFACFYALLLCSSAIGQSLTVQPSRGIRFQGENVSFQISGRIQARHTWTEENGLSNFNIPRIRLALKGTIYDNFKWEFQSDFSRNREATLKDGLIEYAAGNAFNIRFGQFKIRFDRQQYESASRQPFVDRAVSAGRLGLGRDIGVMVHGHFSARAVQYSAGIFNGGGEGGANVPNRGHLLIARVSLNPLGDFGLGLSDIGGLKKHLIFFDAAIAMQGENEEKTIAADNRMVFGAGYRCGPVYFQGEMISRKTKLAGAEVSSGGYYGQASFLVIPERFGLAARYSAFNPDKDADNVNQTEIMGGFNIYLRSLGHDLKFTGDIALIRNEAAGNDRYIRTRAQMQLGF